MSEHICIHVGEGKHDEDFFYHEVASKMKELKDRIEVKRDGDIVLLCGKFGVLNHFKNLMDNDAKSLRKKSVEDGEMARLFEDVVAQIDRGFAVSSR